MNQFFDKMIIKEGEDVVLSSYETTSPKSVSKKEGKKTLRVLRKDLFSLQERLYAESGQSILIIFQAMDAAGKDGTIKHVMRSLNPQGCQVVSFKSPSSLEYSHDFLWRHYMALPKKGFIGIHNRSHYEYVLACKVHPEYNLSEKQKGFDKISAFDEKFWAHRYESIRHFEAHLQRNGTKVIKFFLNVSKDEQKKRLLDRINTEEKNWKFSSADLKERGFWKKYMQAYEKAIHETSTTASPWYIIPADDKWSMRVAVANIVVNELERLHPTFPVLPEEEMKALHKAKEALD